MPHYPVKRSLAERFSEKVDKNGPNGCWQWTAGTCGAGYGAIRSDAPGWPLLKAHRVSYELHCGPIPEGLTIDHLCRNRRCVNPAHLEPVTHSENSRRVHLPLKPHCVRGHEYVPENTGMYAGNRFCRICKRARYRSWARTPAAREWRKQWGTQREARA